MSEERRRFVTMISLWMMRDSVTRTTAPTFGMNRMVSKSLAAKSAKNSLKMSKP